MNFVKCNGEQIPSITMDSVSNNSIPLLLTFPHSGEYYPDDFCPNPALSFEVIDFQNDKFVDELINPANQWDRHQLKLILPGFILMSTDTSMILTQK